MNKETYDEFDNISHLMNKVQWPNPSSSLSARIMAESTAPYATVDIWGRHPALAFFSILIAMALGIGSGFLTSPTNATTFDNSETTAIYGVQTQSVTSFYFQQANNMGGE